MYYMYVNNLLFKKEAISNQYHTTMSVLSRKSYPGYPAGYWVSAGYWLNARYLEKIRSIIISSLRYPAGRIQYFLSDTGFRITDKNMLTSQISSLSLVLTINFSPKISTDYSTNKLPLP